MSEFSWGASLPRIEGKQVALRPMTDADVPSLFVIFSDAEVMRYWSSPPMEEVAAAQALLETIREGWREKRLFQWGIASRDTDEVIGTCTLYNLDTAHRRAEIGFALRRSSWGGGFASEALHLALAFAFETMNLHRLEADADPENERSLRLLERHGFRREGYLRERWHHLGELRDAVFLGLLRSDWNASRPSASGSEMTGGAP